MKKCVNCGKEYTDETTACVDCGGAVETVVEAPKPSLLFGILSLILAFLFPVVGLIMGIIGAVKPKSPTERTLCIVAIIVSVFFVVIDVLLLLFGGAVLMLFLPARATVVEKADMMVPVMAAMLGNLF